MKEDEKKIVHIKSEAKPMKCWHAMLFFCFVFSKRCGWMERNANALFKTKMEHYEDHFVNKTIIMKSIRDSCMKKM